MTETHIKKYLDSLIAYRFSSTNPDSEVKRIDEHLAGRFNEEIIFWTGALRVVQSNLLKLDKQANRVCKMVEVYAQVDDEIRL